MPRPPPPPTEAWIRDLGSRYLERYTPTVASFRSWLRRKVDAAVALHGADPERARAWVEAFVARQVELGVLDDERWATSRVRALRRRGASRRALSAALRAKGVDGDVTERALAGEEGPDPELEAARAYARKSRIGPWRKAPVDDDGRRKELAKMGRKGFGFDVARRALADPEDGE